MPKLTKEHLQNVKYVSLADFSARIDQIEDIDDKVAFATRYLLSHGTGPTDCSFLEAVHVARMKVAEASLKLKDKLYNDDQLDLDPADYPVDESPEIVNAFVEDRKDDLGNEMFMGNPIGYLKGKAKDLVDEIEEKDVELKDDIVLKENCQRLEQELSGKTMKDMLDVDRNATTLDIKLRLQSKFGNRDIYKETKPGFLSRMFGTSSNAAKNLDAVYNAFHNPNHALYGNINALEKAANEYLMHRFPEWRPGQPLPNQQQIGALSGTEKSRTELSAAVIEAAGEQKKVFGHFETLVAGSMRHNIQYSDLKRPEGNEFQQNFQNQLNLDLSDDESSLEDDSVDYSHVYEKAKDNVNESLDMSDDMSAE